MYSIRVFHGQDDYLNEHVGVLEQASAAVHVWRDTERLRSDYPSACVFQAYPADSAQRTFYPDRTLHVLCDTGARLGRVLRPDAYVYFPAPPPDARAIVMVGGASSWRAAQAHLASPDFLRFFLTAPPR